MNGYEKLADLIYPDVVDTIEDLYNAYPDRELDEAAQVTRLGPSPTGPLHVGMIFQALVNKLVAHQSNGIYIVRVDDTDVDRLVEGSEQDIIKTLKYTNTLPDEGPFQHEPHIEERGLYGPYKQTDRKRIYKTFAKYLVSTGKAYPCFMTKSELDQIREEQAAAGEDRGIYGKWARSRTLDLQQIAEYLGNGKPFVIRYKARYPESRRVVINDLIRGPVELPANDNDMILVKSNGLPTYHLAHPVDDSLMQVSVVIRSANHITLTPLHIDIFEAIERQSPVYAHIPLILKVDGNSRRMISKDKDPEMAIKCFKERGYSIEVLIDYLLSLANPHFEEWRKKNPNLLYTNFPFQLSEVPTTDTVFDMNRYHHMTRNYIATLDPGQAYGELLAWTEEFKPSMKALLEYNPSLIVEVLKQASRRKELKTWADFFEKHDFLFDEIYYSRVPEGYDNMPESLRQDVMATLDYLIDTSLMIPIESKKAWIERMQIYATNKILTSESSVSIDSITRENLLQDTLTILNVALTLKANTPDIYVAMKFMGSDRTIRRLKVAREYFGSDA